MSKTLLDPENRICPDCGKARIELVETDYDGPFLGMDENEDAKFKFIRNNCNRMYSVVFTFTGDYDQIRL